MDGKMIGFILYSIFGGVFICLAIYSYFSKKLMRFWANVEVFEVSDIKKYNHAVAKSVLDNNLYNIVSKTPTAVDISETTCTTNYQAMPKLFCIFSIVLIVLGMPLLAGQNSAWILLSVMGVMIESIIAMAVYSLVIEKKYKKRCDNCN